MHKVLIVLAVLVVFIIAGLLLTSCGILNIFPARERGNMKSFKEDDAEMNAAIQQAKDTLPMFISAFQTPTASQTYFGLKVRYPYGKKDGAEHIWVSQLSFDGEQFSGVVGNEPVFVKDLAIGDKVTINSENISDWMIIDDHTLIGGFSIHVVRNKLSDIEREQFDSELGLVIGDEPVLP